MVIDGGGSKRRRRGRRRQLRGSRLNSLGGEGEELEAERMAAMASSGVAGGDGTMRRPARRAGAPLGLGLGFQGGERGRVRQGTMPSFYHDTGEREDRHRRRGGGHGDGMAMAPVPGTVATGEMTFLRKPPSVYFFSVSSFKI